MLAVVVAALAHVPTYSRACTENCCVLPRHHDTSQVVYLKGAGGLEIHLSDLANETHLDIDAVFRDAVDQDTYSLHIGCGGCVASQDPIVTERFPPAGYLPIEVEPFTQTAYRSAIPTANRTFDVSSLSTCTEGHFTIRLVDHLGANRSRPIVWAPVVGLGERFTPMELFLFPEFILRNHGPAWNEMGFTYPLILFLGAPVLLYLGKRLYTWVLCGCFMPHLSGYRSMAREFLYELALVGFTAAALEMLLHLVIVQWGHEIRVSFWIGLLGVVILPNALGNSIAYVAWRGLLRGECCAHRLTGVVEFVLGASLLFLFGAGFFIGPFALMIAALLHIFQRPRVEAVPAGAAPPPARRVEGVGARGYAREVARA